MRTSAYNTRVFGRAPWRTCLGRDSRPTKEINARKKWENGGGGNFPLSRDVFGHFSRYDCPFMAGRRRRRGSRKVDWSSHLIRLRAAAEGYKSVEKMLFWKNIENNCFYMKRFLLNSGSSLFHFPALPNETSPRVWIS